MGVAVSLTPGRLNRSNARLFSWVSLVLLLASIGAVRWLNMNATQAEYVIGLFTSVLLYGLVAQSWAWSAQNEGLSGRIYRSISRIFSNISYSLYMFHLPLAVFLCAVVDSPWHSLRRGPGTLSWYALSDAVILCLVYCLWWLFEARTEAVRKNLFRFETRSP